jgi:hypothetical protein
MSVESVTASLLKSKLTKYRHPFPDCWYKGAERPYQSMIQHKGDWPRVADAAAVWPPSNIESIWI